MQALLPALPIHATAPLGRRFPAAHAAGKGRPCRPRRHPTPGPPAREPGAARPPWLGLSPGCQLGEPEPAPALGDGEDPRRRSQTPPPGVGRSGRVALFYTTPVEFNAPGVGVAAVRVLWRNGVEVTCPPQVCCGMPALDGGDVAGATRRARRNLESLGRAVAAGCDVVVPGPSCSRMLKHEYPRLVPGPATEQVVARVHDLSQYLVKLHGEGKLERTFAAPLGRVAYHAPCHLRVQEIGFKARDVLLLVPGTTVGVLERCTGMDGTWGFKNEFYDASLAVARPLLRELDAIRPDLVVSDCPLAALQIEQARGAPVYHPVEALLAAYEGRALRSAA
ncbi:MAG: hypothetical protein E6J75_07065 [Deltaproteobacteria bacterium]|nr:MAG: hypothetical protein E6J75_07065 [Deltaproteobacteria bacterium]